MPLLLLVDDDPMLRSMIELALRLEGFAVLSAGTAAEAIALFERLPADIGLLVTEVELPGMDGPMLAGRLLERNPDLSVLFLSGCIESMPFDGSSQFEFLAKPFPLKAFVARVRRLMRSKAVPAVN